MLEARRPSLRPVDSPVERPIFDRDLGRNHVSQLQLVGGSHNHKIWEAAEIGKVEGAGVSGPSAPTRPARSSANRTGSFCIATSCTTWS